MQHLLNLARNKEERLFISRCLDQVRAAGRKRKTVRTGFLDPGQAALLKQVGAAIGDVKVQTWGGYGEAERRRACVMPADTREADPDFEVTALVLKPRGVDGAPGHRDYLGAMLALGLKREKLGDCLVQPGEAVFFVSAEIAGFVSQNLSRVGRWTVDVEAADLAECVVQTPGRREKTVTVASPRLDAVLGAAFNLSRSQAAELIKQGRVNVNWRQRLDPAAAVHAGDTLSCRGLGRCEVLEDAGPTRKGRLRLHLGFPAGP